MVPVAPPPPPHVPLPDDQVVDIFNIIRSENGESSPKRPKVAKPAASSGSGVNSVVAGDDWEDAATCPVAQWLNQMLDDHGLQHQDFIQGIIDTDAVEQTVGDDLVPEDADSDVGDVVEELPKRKQKQRARQTDTYEEFCSSLALGEYDLIK